ncbi:MAG TPA: FAD/NAD(P)-binding protein [Candidatus Eremiobacteraceae bacterium]|nr:FAD/NAD(P)-binding protein [Candidatus Eremiobacteraceae bacterium]
MSDLTDRELGMKRNITRRDFLNGVAVTVGAALMPSRLFAGGGSDPKKVPNYYPPALTGLRGSHDGSFETAHSLRDGTFWDAAGTPKDTGESYDLVIVGGGISGLSAAHFYRKTAGANARILILDNHDDFGGHAKRNEFRLGNRTLIGYGGTYSIESPQPYSAVAKSVIEELGIDVASFPKYLDRNLYGSAGRVPKIFFDKETFGSDKLVDDPCPFPGGETYDLAVAGPNAWEHFIAEAPIAEQARKDLARLCREKKDYLPALNSEQKKARLARISYARFLTELARIHGDVIRLYQTISQPLFGVGIEAVPALDAWEAGYPGFTGMLGNPEALGNERKYFFHFPDGNASIARLLVRKLIPGAVPGNIATDVVTAKANYEKLDDKTSSVRLRLNSTVVRVRHAGDPARTTEVEIAYARSGKTYTVRAKHCILACWNMMIPYFCEELPEAQKQALAFATKVPLLYSNVLLHNGRAFQKLGANAIYAPGGYHTSVDIDLPVSIGDYRCPRAPEDPVIVHMSKAPCQAGLPARDQHRIGRIELFTTTFETMERNIREQLARTLGPGGFDPARDIAAITVNRWPHGYAYEYNSLFDSFVLEGGETPCEVARKPFGRIAIANSDAGAAAYTDEAINQAWRAVGELKS